MTTTPQHTPPSAPSTSRRARRFLPGARRAPADVLPRFTVSAERHENALADSTLTIARRLPHLAATALRLAWAADRAAVVWLGVLQFVTGAVTAIGLYATRGALAQLFAAGPTTTRLHHALPALALLTVAAVVRSLTLAKTVTVTARIGPQVDARAELNYLDAATRVPLAAYDDPAWCDQSEAANRGSKDAHLMIEALAGIATAVVGIAAAAGILAALHPVLVPLLVLAVLPRGAAAILGAKAAHRAEQHTLADRRLRHTLMYMASGRATALDVRAHTMRPWLLGRFTEVTGRLETHAVHVGRRTARYQLVGDALAGCGMLLVYATLLALVTGGHIALPAAGTALVAVLSSRNLLSGLVTGLHTTYKVGRPPSSARSTSPSRTRDRASRSSRTSPSPSNAARSSPEHGLKTEIITDLTPDRLFAELEAGRMLIASVHKEIRRPTRPAPGRGGHLVLVTHHEGDTLSFRNPSGHTPESRTAALPSDTFDRFAARRGIAVHV
ncbi:hypothetical protein [Streptomyces sp. GZWMJZ-114]|uniref:hypothetical protein n=1 Tax=Streptomyces sp. GZWMJZ-114 TaxID=2494734 RepID=UPI001010E4A0|nr:hypothetical protein [Streptomyces sp. GZWMJZ-114]